MQTKKRDFTIVVFKCNFLIFHISHPYMYASSDNSFGWQENTMLYIFNILLELKLECLCTGSIPNPTIHLPYVSIRLA